MDSDVVSVTEVAYLLNISSILNQTSPRIVQNYLIWRFMMNRAMSLPRRIRSTREQFDRVFKGTSAEPTRTTTCSKYVNENMGFAVSKLYIKDYFDGAARNQVSEGSILVALVSHLPFLVVRDHQKYPKCLYDDASTGLVDGR
jgi:predicted metalloendopeptidase